MVRRQRIIRPVSNDNGWPNATEQKEIPQPLINLVAAVTTLAIQDANEILAKAAAKAAVAAASHIPNPNLERMATV